MSALKWSIRRAATEFGVSSETVARGLRANGEAVDRGSAFTTKQIVAAIFGDLKRARARQAMADAEVAEMEVAERRGELFPRGEVYAVLGRVLLFIRQQVLELPSSQAQRCNPADPHLARESLVRWRDDFLGAVDGMISEIKQENNDDEGD